MTKEEILQLAQQFAELKSVVAVEPGRVNGIEKPEGTLYFNAYRNNFEELDNALEEVFGKSWKGEIFQKLCYRLGKVDQEAWKMTNELDEAGNLFIHSNHYSWIIHKLEKPVWTYNHIREALTIQAVDLWYNETFNVTPPKATVREKIVY